MLMKAAIYGRVSTEKQTTDNQIQQLLAVEADLSSTRAKAEEYNKLVLKYNKQLNTLPSLQLSFARLERDRSVKSIVVQ